MSGIVTNPNMRRVSRNNMSRFTSRTRDLNAARPVPTASRFGTTDTVTFIKTTSTESLPRIIATCIFEANSEANGQYQQCAYYLSALTAVFPELYNTARSVMQDYGYALETVDENGLQAVGIPMADPEELNKLMVFLGQMVLIPYKNINLVSFARFMSSRSVALCARAGYLLPDGRFDEIAIGYESARPINALLSAHQVFRADLLRCLLANRYVSGPLGRVCDYDCSIIEWCEMSGLGFIFDALCSTKSPVLKDLSVKQEVRSIYEAFTVINTTDYPQYFRIFYPEAATQLLVRNKWKILLAVAQRIRTSTYGTIAQYAPPADNFERVVEGLFEMHQEFIRTSRAADNDVMFRYLGSTDPDDHELGEASAGVQPSPPEVEEV